MSRELSPWLGGLLLTAAVALRGLREDTRPEAIVTATDSREPRARGTPDAGPRRGDEPAESGLRYELSARLDEREHRIAGEGTITWRNSSKRPTSELYFHLYLNAFKNSETLFFRSPFVRARGGTLPTRWGMTTIERLGARELGDVDLVQHLAAHSPGDPLDATDLRVSLPRAVAPGETLTLDVGWTSQLPDVVDRTGFHRDFHFVAQWFPKLARLEDDGRWAHFAFHPHGEFYADFADYDVTLDVPAAAVVGATGRRVAEKTTAERRTLTYRARSVIDFAWTAWPGFVQREAQIDGVHVRLLHPPGHARNADATLGALRFSLPHFQRRYGRYPLDELTVVHPPRHASGAGGMEYPGLITTGGPWHSTFWSRAVDAVTVHELGHQWFHALIASNEQAYPFLDEGLTSYAEMVASRDRLGDAAATDVLGFSMSMRAAQRQNMRASATHLPLALPAAAFPTFRDLGGIVYARTALLLQTLSGVYGADAMNRALSRYAREQGFRHPDPDDLLRAIETEMGRHAAANARRAFFEGGRVDYSIRNLASAPVTEPRGILPQVAANLLGGAGAEGTVQSRLVVHRTGTLAFPVEVLLEDENGKRFYHRWDGEQRFREITHRGDAAIVSAVVDPRALVLIDDDLLNNAACRAPANGLRSVERAVYAAQLALGLLEP